MNNSIIDEYCQVCLMKKGCDYIGGLDCIVRENKYEIKEKQSYQSLPTNEPEIIKNKPNLQNKL